MSVTLHISTQPLNLVGRRWITPVPETRREKQREGGVKVCVGGCGGMLFFMYEAVNTLTFHVFQLFAHLLPHLCSCSVCLVIVMLSFIFMWHIYYTGEIPFVIEYPQQNW